jgi:hypothetical protein
VSDRYCSCGYARFPTPDEPPPFSLEWHVEHRFLHCMAFPEMDEVSRRNLDDFVRWAS